MKRSRAQPLLYMALPLSLPLPLPIPLCLDVVGVDDDVDDVDADDVDDVDDNGSVGGTAGRRQPPSATLGANPPFPPAPQMTRRRRLR